ncbi:MAG: hypothetical protein ACRDPB_05060 [Nocardioidaceae bacterium]
MSVLVVAALASGDLFVHDPVDRARLAARADLVDMERYAVAYACTRFDVPVRLVKHVSDNADGTALDWPAALDRSARALVDPDDDYLISLAEASKAMLVSGDADLQGLAGQIPVQSPESFRDLLAGA